MKRISLLIALNRDHKILLQHKSADAPNNPNTWCLFGGGIEDGESPEEAVRRELLEELQLQINPVFFKSTTDLDIERNYFFSHLDVEVEVLKKQQMEGDDLGYFSLAEMNSLKMNTAHHQAVRDFLSSNLLHNIV